jgi:hypothetical protein
VWKAALLAGLQGSLRPYTHQVLANHLAHFEKEFAQCAFATAADNLAIFVQLVPSRCS